VIRQRNRHLNPMIVSALAVLGWASSVQAAFVLEFDPSQTTVQSNGLNQTFSINMLITHDGSADPSTFSGLSFRLNDPGNGLSYSNAGEVDFDFSQDPQVTFLLGDGSYAIGASSNDTEQNVGFGASQRLMSVDFLLDDSVVSRTFQLDLTLTDAKRGTANTGGLIDIADEVTVADGMFTVTAAAVPEPGNVVLFLMGIATLLVRWFHGIRQPNFPADRRLTNVRGNRYPINNPIAPVSST